MATAKMTLVGLYKYMQFPGAPNHNLFTKLNVPTGIDKDKLINTILYNGGEFEVLYADPVFFKDMIGIWSDKTQFTMERWANALAIEYNPLENYDRMENWIDANKKTGTDTVNRSELRSGSDSNTDAQTVTGNESAVSADHSESSGTGNTENTVSAYDSATYVPHDNAESSTSGQNDASTMSSANRKTVTENAGSAGHNELSAGQDIQNHDSNDDTMHSGHIHGNIGVTTSQQMLQSELDIARFNIYDELAWLFLRELTIYTY